jgi:hypothetical protein
VFSVVDVPANWQTAFPQCHSPIHTYVCKLRNASSKMCHPHIPIGWDAVLLFSPLLHFSNEDQFASPFKWSTRSSSFFVHFWHYNAAAAAGFLHTSGPNVPMLYTTQHSKIVPIVLTS